MITKAMAGLAAALLLAGGGFTAWKISGNDAPTVEDTAAADTAPQAPASVTVAATKIIGPGASWSAAYAQAAPGDVIQVNGGTYGNQVIDQVNGRANTCSADPAVDPTSYVSFVPAPGADVQINGSLEIHGSCIWVKGTRVGERAAATYNIHVTGYVDTEGNGGTAHPDHIYVEGVDTTSFGMFNAAGVTFRYMDVGPQTVSSNVNCVPLEGPGIENKIGFAGDGTYVPTNLTIDGLFIHDQNGDAGRLTSDCHMGALFLQTANGLTIKNSVFQKNVVYHIQVQSFNGAPFPQNVVIDGNSFSCAVNWLYQGAACEQRGIQFDQDPDSQFTIRNNVYADDFLYGCYVGSCGGMGDFDPRVDKGGNVSVARSSTAPPLGGGGGTTTGTTTTQPTTTAPTTTVPTTTTAPTTTAPTTTAPPPDVRAQQDGIYTSEYWPQVQQITAAYSKWRQQNPGEASKLDAYRADRCGTAAPALVTHFGRALVAVERIEALAVC